MGFSYRTSDPERNAMGQNTEMSPLVSMLFRTFLNPLKFFKKIFNILVYICNVHTCILACVHYLCTHVMHVYVAYLSDHTCSFIAAILD